MTVGAPAVPGAAVDATVERHLKGDKVLVFKKKRRKGCQKMNGFRPSLTELVIKDIKLGGKAEGRSEEEELEKGRSQEAGSQEAGSQEAGSQEAGSQEAAPKKKAEDKGEE